MLEDGAETLLVVACESPPNVKLLEAGALVAGCEPPPNVKLDAGGITDVLGPPNWNGALAVWLWVLPKSNDGVAIASVPETKGFLKEPWSPPPELKVKEFEAGAPPLPNESAGGWLESVVLLVFEMPPKRLDDGALLVPAPNANPVLGAVDFAKMLGCAFAASGWDVVLPNSDTGAGASAGLGVAGAGVVEGLLPKEYVFVPSCEAAPKIEPASSAPLAAAAVFGGRLAAEVGAPPPKENFLLGWSVEPLPKTAAASSESGFFLFGADSSFFSSAGAVLLAPNKLDDDDDWVPNPLNAGVAEGLSSLFAPNRRLPDLSLLPVPKREGVEVCVVVAGVFRLAKMDLGSPWVPGVVAGLPNGVVLAALDCAPKRLGVVGGTVESAGFDSSDFCPKRGVFETLPKRLVVGSDGFVA
jgi:hypothetical protein